MLQDVQDKSRKSSGTRKSNIKASPRSKVWNGVKPRWYRKDHTVYYTTRMNNLIYTRITYGRNDSRSESRTQWRNSNEDWEGQTDVLKVGRRTTPSQKYKRNTHETVALPKFKLKPTGRSKGISREQKLKGAADWEQNNRIESHYLRAVSRAGCLRPYYWKLDCRCCGCRFVRWYSPPGLTGRLCIRLLCYTAAVHKILADLLDCGIEQANLSNYGWRRGRQLCAGGVECLFFIV